MHREMSAGSLRGPEIDKDPPLPILYFNHRVEARPGYNLPYTCSWSCSLLQKQDLTTIRQLADRYAAHYAASSQGRAPPVTPGLPLDYTLRSDGARVVLRAMREGEEQRFYETFCRGGYGWDEMPTLVRP